jgi:uncharacterized RDD family membrane protein YckC
MPASLKASLELATTLPASMPEVEVPSARPSNPDRYLAARIDHFVIERRLGSGGMGAVYLARDTSLDRLVALKILPDELALRAEAQGRFIREAQAQARLRSPHVVQIYHIGHVPAAAEGRGSLYFAMELVDGESLEARVNRGERLDPEEARKFMIQVARGLHDAHDAGIVHRDIKPSNLLIDKNGYIKIVDFGLAKPRDTTLGLTLEGAVMGTPYYMAPEQARGEQLDHRADMYALGCSFYHLLAGTEPFVGPTPVVVMSKHLTEQPTPVREHRSDVPPRLAAILERLMAKPPSGRYASYDELIAELQAAAPEVIEYAGFGTRAAAAAIDAVLASVLITLLGWPGLFVYITYVTAAHAYRGQTLAKYALRIQVLQLDGRPLGLARSLARTAVSLWLPCFAGLLILSTQGLSGLTIGISKLTELEGAKDLIVPIIVSNVLLTLVYGAGFGIAALHPEKRTVHDLCAGSHVLYRLRAQTTKDRKKS